MASVILNKMYFFRYLSIIVVNTENLTTHVKLHKLSSFLWHSPFKKKIGKIFWEFDEHFTFLKQNKPHPFKIRVEMVQMKFKSNFQGYGYGSMIEKMFLEINHFFWGGTLIKWSKLFSWNFSEIPLKTVIFFALPLKTHIDSTKKISGYWSGNLTWTWQMSVYFSNHIS